MRYAPILALLFVSSPLFAQVTPDSTGAPRDAPPSTVRLAVYGDAGGGWTRRAADPSGALAAVAATRCWARGSACSPI